ncbi:MAG: leucyl/phenylalanyl-tRNA--protein transferase [Neisseria sp.]|nr:leucyl/phenylalanyl-tRNA--protein transferase [Neisseria sp.]
MNVPFLVPNDFSYLDVETAVREYDGLVGVSADLQTARLLDAYRCGIFPWFSERGLFYWFATVPRTVLFPEKFHIGKSLAKTLRNKTYRVTANRDFAAVISHCAAVPREGQDGSWIAPEFQTAYRRLHELGHAHSFECFMPDGDGRLKLEGGFYGVQIGRVFYGESMFALRPDASKIAFACAVPYLARCGIALIDCQQDTQYLRRFGSQTLPFADFQTALHRLNGEPLTAPIGGLVAENGLADGIGFCVNPCV